MKHSDWLEIVMVLGITNQSASFQHRENTRLLKLFVKSAHGLIIFETFSEEVLALVFVVNIHPLHIH